MKKIKLKYILFVMALLVITGIVFALSGGNGYKLETVSKRDLTQTVSLTGRVQAQQEAELSFERGGKVANLPVGVGNRVVRGQVILELNTATARRDVDDARIDLDSAKADLLKLENAAGSELVSNKLAELYEDGMAVLDGVYDNLRSNIDDLDSIYFGNELSSDANENNIEFYVSVIDVYDQSFLKVPDQLMGMHRELERSYPLAFVDYKEDAVDRAITSGLSLLRQANDTIKIGRDTIQFFIDKSSEYKWTATKQSSVDSHLSDLQAMFEEVNADYIKLLSIVNEIKGQKDAVATEKIDIEDARLVVAQKEIALREAQGKLSDLYLRAPFDGVLTRLDVELGEAVAANTTVAGFISSAPLEIEANVPEVDVAKIKVGDRGEAALDAFGIEESWGVVVRLIDPAETLVDGVPSYRTLLDFEKIDGRIKPGLTANLELITASKENVLAVPTSAVVVKDGKNFVKVMRSGEPVEVPVQTGLRSSDGYVEIVSGLEEGDEVVTSSVE